MNFGRTQTFGMCIRITLKFSFFPLSVPSENITTLNPETTPKELSRWVREGLDLWRSHWGSWERVLLGPNMKIGVSGAIAVETGAEESSSKWEQEMISY